MNFKNVSPKYRPIPFWSWNEKLCTEETKEQVRKMNHAGIGGFFMHARGGLQTEYMGEEWFDNVEASIEAAEECGMRPWAYDENGWPSGFGSGIVNGLGIAYQQKYLRMEEEPLHTENVIGKCGAYYFYYDINPFYVDTLDRKVIAKFLDCIYRPYYEKYGNRIEGFFTDEPQISRDGIPWSFVFEEEYRARYQEEITDCLEQLFLPVGDYRNTRVKFWKMVTDLFSDAFMKQIYDWCDERGLKLTGHLVLEESLETQLTTNGACMPHYEYFHIPGMDWLGRPIFKCLTTMQLSSVAEQLGRKSVLSETFALCGHNVSFAELKGNYEWQMVHGINLLCQHLEGYSIRGIRKRDFPPVMYLQQPWWEEYKRFNDAMSREGMVLRDGEHQVDVLVLHPQTTAWSIFDNGANEGMEELNDKLLAVIDVLERKHIAFHLGDETIMERHGKVCDGKLVIGKQSYTCVIDPGCELLLDSTSVLLEQYLAAGGKLIKSVEELKKGLAANEVIDLEEITYTSRTYNDFTAHYFVNTSAERKQAQISVTAKKLDIYSGELEAFNGVHEFEPWGSLMLIEEKKTENDVIVQSQTDAVGRPAVAQTLVRPAATSRVLDCSGNCLTLDKCDYYFDGELQERNGYVLNISERANMLEKAVQIHQDYHVTVEYLPEKLYLVCERPEQFIIRINGVIVTEELDGYFRDQSFRKLEVAKYMKLGENIISFDCNFVQSEEFYQNLKKAMLFESELNKLAYDMEIEAIYLLGDFSVRTDGEWSALERSGMRYCGGFVLAEPKITVENKHLEMQGYPFFCGSLTLETELVIEGENPILDIDWKGFNVLKVEIGDTEKVMLTDNRLPLKEFGVQGTVKAKLTLINNLRNLLGPHHLEVGESHAVIPGSFFKEPCVWNKHPEKDWNEDYCFVEVGI